MNDTISRQAAIEACYQEHDASYSTLEAKGAAWRCAVNIKNLPSVQPEIIRCKDCKYWNKGSCEYPEHAVNCQDYWVGDIETEAEHFCGYAERKLKNDK